MKPALSSLRIIGGKWRSRQITFPALDGVRPTPNRVRETLFNWLAPYIQGARCLDLFAGSGALGFEAISRGAATVTMIDREPQIIAALQANAERLKTDQIELLCGEFPSQLQQRLKPGFDIVFLDPPFQQNLLAACIQWLQKFQLLNQHALIYIEMQKNQTLPDLPLDWEIIKSKTAGQVRYLLLVIHS